MPLLKTKLYIPPPQHTWVSRSRLIERLNDGIGRKLTLLSAPAGFGKTALLSAWVAEVQKVAGNQEREPVRTAWLSLDREDDNVVRLWTYLVTALQTVHAELGQEVLQHLGTPGALEVQSILTSLLNEIADLSHATLLVLDDYHVLSSREIHAGIEFLLDHLPPQLHLVLSTRADPPLPIHRLRARGQLTELRAGDLRFTDDEARAFLNETMGLGLSPQETEALEMRTEGWIAGLQLAALSLEGRADAREFIAAFAGSHHYVLEYLSEEVLRRQPALVQHFLLRTSILDRLHGPLCDFVLGPPVPLEDGAEAVAAEGELRGPIPGGGSEMLAYLHRSNLFLSPLDDAHHWYRYHHLFADLLGNRLRQELSQEQISELHRRASAWHANHGSAGEAVKHALSARDFHRAAQLIEGHFQSRTTDLEVTAQMNWMGALPEDVVRSRPLLCVIQAWALFFNGQIEGVEPWLQAAEQGMQISVAEQPPDAQAAGLSVPLEAARRNVLGSAAALRAFIADRRGNVSRAIELVRRADELLPADDVVARSIIPYVLGRAHRLGGNLDQASQACAEMVRIGRAAGNVLTIAMGLCELATVYKIQGQLHRAEGLYQEALELATRREHPQLPLAAIVNVGLSDLLREQNDLRGARQRAQRVVDNLEGMRLWGMPTDLTSAYTNLARVFLAQGEDDEALGVLEQAERAREQYAVFPEFGSLIDMCRVRVWLAQGALQEAIRWAADVSTQLVPGGADGERDPLLIREAQELMVARVRIAEGKARAGGAPIDQARQMLARLADRAQGGGRAGTLIEILALQAAACSVQGDAEGALEALGKSLQLAEPQGYVRVFLDEGTAIADLLRLGTARRVWRAPRLASYVDKLLQAHDEQTHAQPRTASAQGSAPAGSPSPLVEPLTPRELQVLRLVAEGCSNREIARELVITLSTVKKHTGSIYGKLGVTSRTQALSRALQLGLISPDL